MTGATAAVCPVCAAGATRPAMPYVVRPRVEDDLFRELHLWACGTCGSHVAEPRPAPAVLASYYAQAYRTDGRNVAAGRGFPADHPWYLSRGVTVATLVRQAMGVPPKTAVPIPVLEIGPGYGHTLFALRRALESPLHITAIEPDPSCHSTLRTVADRVISADLDGTPAPALCEGPFHIVLLLHVLEHVADPLTFLTTIRTLMPAGAVLALEVPHCPPVRVRWYNLETPHVPHLFFFTQGGLTALLGRAGFAIDSLTTYGPRFNDAGGYDASFARAPSPVTEFIARGALPPPPFPIFAESGPDRLFLRAIARVTS